MTPEPKAIVDDERPIVAFYDQHPITLEQILAKVVAERGGLDGVSAEDLYPFDQDHYGGLPVNDAMAERANLSAEDLVLDVCGGLGGPARYHAQTRGCRVVVCDLNRSRVVGAAALSRLVGMADRVQAVCGDALHLPFASGTFDAAMSQEAFLHIPGKAALVAECRRLLKPSGRLVFTDCTAGATLTDDDREAMWNGFKAQEIESIEGYVEHITAAGFAEVSVEDLSTAWVPILQERLRMYQGLREDAVRATGSDPHKLFAEFYARFVDMMETGALGGARFTAVR